MIPKLISYPNVEHGGLPEGAHDTTLQEMKDRFTFSDLRKFLFDGLIEAVEVFSMACCIRLYLIGRFVTSIFDQAD